MSGTSGQPGRYQRSSGGLVTAMAVLVLGILAFVVLRSCTRDVPDNGVDPVDYQPVAAQARQAGLVAPAPSPLPSGWKATSVRFTPPKQGDADERGSWHLGLLTDDRRYVALEETAEDVDSVLPDTVADARQGGVVRLDGHTWRTWTGTDGAYALTTRTPGERTVLVGSPAGSKVVREVVDRLSLPTS